MLHVTLKIRTKRNKYDGLFTSLKHPYLIPVFKYTIYSNNYWVLRICKQSFSRFVTNILFLNQKS